MPVKAGELEGMIASLQPPHISQRSGKAGAAIQCQRLSGRLPIATANEAFFVACDRSTMTQDDIDNGRLIGVTASDKPERPEPTEQDLAKANANFAAAAPEDEPGGRKRGLWQRIKGGSAG